MTRSLVLSRQPLAKRPLEDWLDAPEGSVALLTTERAVEDRRDVLAERFLAHRLVDDYRSWATEQVAEAFAREQRVDRVASTSEHDVLRAARLRERLGLPGQGVASATAYRDKVVMKTLAAAAGLGVPAFAAVDSPADLLDFLDGHGYPVVVKPRLGFGAEDVTRLDDEKDVARWLAAEGSSPVPYVTGQWMVESFVVGELFHVDGMMRDGQVVHAWPAAYTSGLMERLRDQLPVGSVLLDPDDPRTALLQQHAADVVAALPAAPHPLAFHLEAWLPADGRGPVLCEIASRAGGGLLAETYERQFGVELAREGLRAQCGSDLTLDHQPAAPRRASGWTFAPPGVGRLVPPAGPCPVPEAEVRLLMAPGTMARGVVGVTDGAARIFVEADGADAVRRALADAVRWWEEEARWT